MQVMMQASLSSFDCVLMRLLKHVIACVWRSTRSCIPVGKITGAEFMHQGQQILWSARCLQYTT